MKQTKKVLIIVTNVAEYQKSGVRTGLWLSELTHFYDVLEKSGIKMDIASPQGGFVPLDPASLVLTEVAGNMGYQNAIAKRYEDRKFMDLLSDTIELTEEISAEDYDAIYLSGGHGTMFDFKDNEVLQNLIVEFYESGKIVSGVCHGPCALLDAKLSDGNYLVMGKKLTAFSWREEEIAKREKAVPYNLEDELKKRGAQYTKAILPQTAHVVEDDHLITGENPASAIGVGEAVVKKLEKMMMPPKKAHQDKFHGDHSRA